MKARFSDFLF